MTRSPPTPLSNARERPRRLRDPLVVADANGTAEAGQGVCRGLAQRVARQLHWVGRQAGDADREKRGGGKNGRKGSEEEVIDGWN